MKGALDQSLANMTVDTWNRVHDLAKGQARTQADLSRLSKEVASVQDKVVQVGERVTELADSVNALGLELQKAAWDKLNPEQKREALAKVRRCLGSIPRNARKLLPRSTAMR